MNQNVTAAVNAARQAIQAETARVKKEIVLHEGNLKKEIALRESEIWGLKKQLTELEPLLARFDGQPAKPPPTDDDVGKFVAAMMAPAKGTKKSKSKSKAAAMSRAEKAGTVLRGPSPKPLTVRILTLLSDKKARESSDIEAAFPLSNRSTVRSAIHTLVRTGEVEARGEAGRRRYTASASAVDRLVVAAVALRSAASKKPTSRAAPLRDMITAYLRTQSGGRSSEQIFDFVSKHSATSRTTLSVMLSSMKKSGQLAAAPFTPTGGGRGFLYSLAKYGMSPGPVTAPATATSGRKTPRKAPVREMILSYLREHPRSTAAQVFDGVKSRHAMSRSNLGTHLYDMKDLGMVMAEPDSGGTGRYLYSVGKAPTGKTLSADKPKSMRVQGRPGPNGVLNEMILDIARTPVSVDAIRTAVEKARPGTTTKTIWSSLKDLREQGRLHATGPRGQYRYLRIWK